MPETPEAELSNNTDLQAKIIVNLTEILSSIGFQVEAISLRPLADYSLRLDIGVVIPVGVDPDFAQLLVSLNKLFLNPEVVFENLKRRYQVAKAINNVLSNFTDLGPQFNSRDPMVLSNEVNKFLRGNGINLEMNDIIEYLSLKGLGTLNDLLKNSHEKYSVRIPLNFVCVQSETAEEANYPHDVTKFLAKDTPPYISLPSVLGSTSNLNPDQTIFLQPVARLAPEKLTNKLLSLTDARIGEPKSVLSQFLFGLAQIQTKKNVTVGQLINNVQLVGVNPISASSNPNVKNIIQLANPFSIKYYSLPDITSLKARSADIEKAMPSIIGYLTALAEDIYHLNNFIKAIIDAEGELTVPESSELRQALAKYSDEITTKIRPYANIPVLNELYNNIHKQLSFLF